MEQTNAMPQYIAKKLAALPTPLTPAQKRMVTMRKNIEKKLRYDVLACFAMIVFIVSFFYLAVDGYLKAKQALDATYAQQNVIQVSTVLESHIVAVEVAQAEELTFATPMHKAIHDAANEFGVPESLMLGIAKAESSLGTHFAHDYDYNCHNWWGIRKVRDDGSYLRCFNDEVAGARTAAKLLATRYIGQGLDTPEKICPVWIGKKFAKQNCPHWIENVKSVN